MIKSRISLPVVSLALAVLGCTESGTDGPSTDTTGSNTATGPMGTEGTSNSGPGVGPTATSAGNPNPTTGNTGGATGNTTGTAPTTNGQTGNTTGPVGNTTGPTPSTDPTNTAPNTDDSTSDDTTTTPVVDVLPPDGVVTSAQGAYWTAGTLTEGAGAATVTVTDTESHTWEGFGGSFNERGWSYLTTAEMKEQAITMLFSASEGANFAWGRIPMGSSDYGIDRYSLNDTAEDVIPDGSESNRPPADFELAMFSLERDGEHLIPFIQAAQAEKPNLRFWASPWSPPSWMKTGYKQDNPNGGDAVRPSYFDGGNMKGDADTLEALANYFVKFVEGYGEQGIDVEVVAPQNEPGYEQNYPSCLWSGETFRTFVGQHLGPKMQDMGVKVMLGTMSNPETDLTIAQAVTGDATARGYISMAGVQWGVLDSVNSGTGFDGLPVWATEHRCGNYPWDMATYNSTQAPNDHAYGVESWGYIRNAIVQGKVTTYSAWNMVLDRNGLGNDLSRDWRQNALLVAEGGTVTPTPAYYVFRHFSQYVAPGAKVLAASGGEAVAFENPDGSLVAVAYNSGAANPNYSVAMGGKTFQVNMPSNGWATVKFTP